MDRSQPICDSAYQAHLKVIKCYREQNVSEIINLLLSWNRASNSNYIERAQGKRKGGVLSGHKAAWQRSALRSTGITAPGIEAWFHHETTL